MIVYGGYGSVPTLVDHLIRSQPGSYSTDQQKQSPPPQTCQVLAASKFATENSGSDSESSSDSDSEEDVDDFGSSVSEQEEEEESEDDQAAQAPLGWLQT